VQEGFLCHSVDQAESGADRHLVSLNALTFQYPSGGREAVDGALGIPHGETVPRQVTLNSHSLARDIAAQGGEWLP
jgi:hypothetical protein